MQVREVKAWNWTEWVALEGRMETAMAELVQQGREGVQGLESSLVSYGRSNLQVASVYVLKC